MQLFHYHLVTSRVRDVEARYVGKLGFDLVARHGRVDEELTSLEPGVSWEELDAKGFKLRLTELEKGAVNVVVQPGQWPVPRVDHLGLVLDEDEFEATLELPSGSISGSRSTPAGGRSSRRTPGTGSRSTRRATGSTSCWSEDELRLDRAPPQSRGSGGEGERRSRRSSTPSDGNEVVVGDTVVRFVRGGPQGRPELFGELFP